MAKLYYEKEQAIYASEKTIPTENDTKVIDRDNLEGHALVYAKDGKIFASETGIPAETDTVLYTAEAGTTGEPETTAEAVVEETVNVAEPATISFDDMVAPVSEVTETKTTSTKTKRSKATTTTTEE